MNSNEHVVDNGNCGNSVNEENEDTSIHMKPNWNKATRAHYPNKIVEKATADPYLKRTLTRGKDDPDSDGWFDAACTGRGYAKPGMKDWRVCEGGLVDWEEALSDDRHVRQKVRSYSIRGGPYNYEEDYLIVRKICQVKAFRYTGGLSLYNDMAECKDFKGKRSGSSLHERFRRHIKPKLLNESTRKLLLMGCEIPEKDADELLKGIEASNLNKHSNVAPKYHFK